MSLVQRDQRTGFSNRFAVVGAPWGEHIEDWVSSNSTGRLSRPGNLPLAMLSHMLPTRRAFKAVNEEWSAKILRLIAITSTISASFILWIGKYSLL